MNHSLWINPKKAILLFWKFLHYHWDFMVLKFRLAENIFYFSVSIVMLPKKMVFYAKKYSNAVVAGIWGNQAFEEMPGFSSIAEAIAEKYFNWQCSKSGKWHRISEKLLQN